MGAFLFFNLTKELRCEIRSSFFMEKRYEF